MKKALTSISVFFLLSIFTFAQEKITMNVKDLNSDIEKYVKKNFEGFKITEAFEYDVIYEMVVHKADSNVSLLFNRKGVFLYKKTEAIKAKLDHQTRMSMAVKDVESDISKYIKKNYEGFTLKEAYKYDEVYVTKVVKGADTEILLFDKDGKFEKKIAAKPVHHVEHKTDSVHAKPVTEPIKSEPAKIDSLK